jgi:hypothetical protein
MVSRLRRRQRPRRFYRPAADVQYLKQLHLALKKVPLQTGLRLHSRRNEQPPHQKACGITNSRRFTGDHCTSSDNDLRLGRLDSSSDCLRANATVKRPSLTSPYEGREPAIKAKESEVQSVGGTDGLIGGGNRFGRGSLTYGDHHLSTDDSGHLPTNTAPANGGRPSAHRQVLTPILATGVRTGLSQNTNIALAAYDMLCDPPVHPEAQGEPGPGRPTHGATDTRAADGQPRSAPAVGGGIGSSTRAAQAGEPDTRQLTAPRTANALLPRSLREGAGRCPCGGGAQLGAPSSPAQMMNILEAEGRGRPRSDSLFPTTRPTIIILGDRRRGTAAGLHDENP